MMSRAVDNERWAAVCVVAIFLQSGCGPSRPFPMTKIRGVVTYEDGSPIPGDRVVVTFVPQVEPVDPKTHPRSAHTVLDKATGEFDVVTTSAYGDGIIRGEHKVFIVAVDKRDNQLPSVPPPYRNAKTSPLTIRTDDSPLEIRIPKP